MSEEITEREKAALRAMERYEKAAHAVQTGVAYEQARGSNSGSAKHLRTGLNLRATDHAALADLLIKKGVIDELEYLEAIAAAAEREVTAYEERLSAGGLKVTLG